VVQLPSRLSSLWICFDIATDITTHLLRHLICNVILNLKKRSEILVKVEYKPIIALSEISFSLMVSLGALITIIASHLDVPERFPKSGSRFLGEKCDKTSELRRG